MRIAGGSSHEVMRCSFLWSEVKAESHLQTDSALVRKIVNRHLIVGSRFDGEVFVDEEGVAHFHGDGEVVAFGRIVDVSCLAPLNSHSSFSSSHWSNFRFDSTAKTLFAPILKKTII